MPPKTGSSLLQRVTLLLVLGVGTPLALFSFLSISSIRQTLTLDWNLLQTQVGHTVSSMVGAHVAGSLSDLATLEAGLREASGRIELRSLLPGRAEALFVSFLKGSGKVVRLELLDLEGKGIHTGFEYQEEAVLRRIRTTYEQALKAEGPVVSAPVSSIKLNQILFVASRPLYNDSAKAGFLLAVVSLEPVFKSIREESWSGIRLMIVAQGGKLLIDLDRNRVTENADYDQNQIVQALLTSVRGMGTITRPFTSLRDGKEIPMIGTGVVIPAAGWLVIAEAVQSDAYAGISTAVWRILILAVGALALAFAVSFFFLRNLVEPLRRLVDFAHQAAAGDLPNETDIDSRGEIGAVARAFLQMTRQLEENVASLKRAVEDSKQLFTGIIRALASAIDGKDPYTRGHSERVTRFSVEIAKLMELPEDEVEKIKVGALIHDVGKIAIDDKILKKPGALTDEEFRIMKTHPARGYEMMKHIPQLNDIIPGMQSHHEQLDGKGYPQGLTAEQIPMIARVIMVADCFDAMTTKRPYQDPAPIDYVLGEIKSLAGKKYDERAVDALIRGVKTGRIIPHSAT